MKNLNLAQKIEDMSTRELCILRDQHKDPMLAATIIFEIGDRYPYVLDAYIKNSNVSGKRIWKMICESQEQFEWAAFTPA